MAVTSSPTRLDAATMRELDAQLCAKWAEDEGLLEKLAPQLSSTETARIAIIRRAVVKGIDSVLARRALQASQDEAIEAIRNYIAYGAASVLNVGGQRGGDFLLNQLRGQWAEDVAMSVPIPGYHLVRFGPSSAAMPGEQDHDAIVRAFRQIVLTEGKRPDLLAFATDTWDVMTEAEQAAVTEWPSRPLRAGEPELVSAAACGIEVKNSTWAYKVRRDSGNTKPLSITVKDEEIESILGWERETGLPMIFFQVLFDELYCMSFARMAAAIDAKAVYGGDYVNEPGAAGKDVHWFLLTELTRQRHQLADVVFPSGSEAVVRVMGDGNVIPYIRFQPAAVTGTRPEVFEQELGFRL
jgi:hypothetical protein